MFGYVIANLEGLTQAQKDRYKGCYCGLCRVLKQRHGFSGRLTLTYDMTFLVLLLSALMVVFCLTAGANPVPGYTPPHDSAYYAGHLDELAQELNTNFLPVLDETAHAEADGGTVTVTASEKEYVPVRGAVLKFYDAALFTFEKANQN